MIYTLTLNPSIDYLMSVEELSLGSVNRSASEAKYPGGKGINVSRILKRLDLETCALGYIGGFVGDFIKQTIEKEGIQTSFIEVDQDSRINVKIKGQSETEINGRGPEISSKQVQNLKQQLSQLPAGSVLVFAGSANPNLGNVIYQELIPIAKKAGLEVVCDFEGQTLLDTLQYQPLLVKPNNHELGAIFGKELTELDEIIFYGQELRKKGAQHVLVSMASDGAVLVSETGAYFAQPIIGQVQNSVGAGDSMVAGFVAAYQETKNPLLALKLGVACGTATAFSKDLASRQEIDQMLEKVEVIEK